MLSNPLAVFGAPPEEASVPRPSSCYIPHGEISRAWEVSNPYEGIPSRKKPTAAQRAGLAYQNTIGGFLHTRTWTGTVVDGPWFAFHDDTASRHYCQPDFVLRDESGENLLIIEVKIRWTADAWWQLRKLYEPVVAKALAQREHGRIADQDCAQRDSGQKAARIRSLCITKSFDPAISIPEEVAFVDNLESAQRGAFNVLVLR